MGKQRESDEGEREDEEVHGEGADLGPADEGVPEESDVVEVGGSGGMDELEDIDEVTPQERPPAPPPPALPERRDREPMPPERGRDGGRGDRPAQQDRGGRNDRGGGRDRGGRNERGGRDRGGRGGRGRDRDRGPDRGPERDRGADRGAERGPERERGSDRGPDRDRDRDRGPDRDRDRAAAPMHPSADRGDGPPHDPSHRDLSRAGRHEPLPDEIMPPDEDTAPKIAPPEEDDGPEWALLEEFSGEPAERSRRGERTRGEVDELGVGSGGIDALDSSRDGRRRGLEPGLSLRDLMPFLRPPKSVVVAGVSTGAGHSRVARALYDGLKSLDRNLTIRDLDLLDHLSQRFRPGYVRAVLDDIQRRPALFGVPFETQPPSSAELMPADFDEFLTTIFDEKLEQALLDRRPEWIVLSHWLPLRWLEAKAAAGATTLPKVAVVASDPDYHDWWFSPIVKAWLVSNSDFAQRLQAKGVEADAIQVVGVPVDPAFRSSSSRDGTTRELGLRRDLPTVLMRPGGVGVADRTIAVAKRLLEGAVPMNLLVVAGKNDRLREELEKLGPSSRSLLKAFGFVDRFHELMAVADVLITRATPQTTAEAAAAGVPLVLLRPTPGVEERVADRLVAEGAAVVVRDEASLENELLDLLRNRRRLRFMHERALELAQPDGGTAALDKLTKLIR
jgi:processive 1,2-diacylglycerol beta-glucosyltransferase